MKCQVAVASRLLMARLLGFERSCSPIGSKRSLVTSFAKRAFRFKIGGQRVGSFESKLSFHLKRTFSRLVLFSCLGIRVARIREKDELQVVGCYH